MIDVKKTILSTLTDKINRMRFLADSNYKGLKKILSLVILDDLYDWSAYLNDSQIILKKLKDLRTDYILCLRDFHIEYSPSENWFTNVNIDGYDGSRFSDLTFEVINITNDILEVDPQTPSQESVICERQVIYYPNDRISSNNEGKPDFGDIEMTECDKNNFYYNTETKIEYYYDNGTWILINNPGLTQEEVIELIRNNRGQISATLNQDENLIDLSIINDGTPEAIHLITESELEGLI